MDIKKVLIAAIAAVVLASSFPVNAQERPAGFITGLTPAQSVAAGLGLVVAGVLIADEIGSSGSGPLSPVDPPPVDPPPVDETPATETPATSTTGT